MPDVSYSRVNWEDSPSTNTPINAANLNVMDKGISDCATEINNRQPKTDNNLTTTAKTIPGAINELNADLGNKIEAPNYSSATDITISTGGTYTPTSNGYIYVKYLPNIGASGLIEFSIDDLYFAYGSTGNSAVYCLTTQLLPIKKNSVFKYISSLGSTAPTFKFVPC